MSLSARFLDTRDYELYTKDEHVQCIGRGFTFVPENQKW